MAAQNGRTDPALADELFDEPYRFSFFQAVRLLERLSPERQAVGRASRPAREVVRFNTLVSLNFPPSEIYELTDKSTPEDSQPATMTVPFLGMTGPSGVLPNAYTELLMERLRQKDTALHDFLDLFNHRALSLFYRAWEKHRFAVAFEQGREDRFTEYLFDLIGMGTRGLQGKLGLPDKGLLCYGGLIGQRPHSASAIGAILTDYFGVRARVEQFFGQWLQLEQSDLTKLGRANHRLGVMTIAGARVWDSQSKFRVRIGPLSYQQFIAFLPSGSAFEPIKALTRFLAGMEFDFDYQLLLKADEVPGTMLTTRARRKPMLGWNTWLKTKEMEEDDGQVVLR